MHAAAFGALDGWVFAGVPGAGFGSAGCGHGVVLALVFWVWVSPPAVGWLGGLCERKVSRCGRWFPAGFGDSCGLFLMLPVDKWGVQTGFSGVGRCGVVVEIFFDFFLSDSPLLGFE